MIFRRIGPIVVLAFLATVVLGARLWRVQVVEHELWAQQAARLLHSGAVLPPDRGRILDATGTIVARDLETYRLVLTYRDFRRGHPLGLVAHARSALEARAIPLPEAEPHLLEWAWDLVHLTPNALEAFAEGEAFRTETLGMEGVDDVRDAHRARRASDVRFYLRELLGLSPRSWKRIAKETRREGRDRPYLELAAGVLADPVAPDVLWKRVEARLVTSIGHLIRLADRMEVGDDRLALGFDGLLVELEAARVAVEDDAASRLFRETFGFAPGRVAPETLFRFFELEWIGRMLAWEPARLTAWAERARGAWLEQWLDEYALPSVCADLVLDASFEPGPDDFLDRVAVLFAPEGAVEAALERADGAFPSWRAMPSAAVFSELDGLFQAEFARGREAFGRPVLPVLDPELRGLDPPDDKRWLLIDRARNVLPAEDVHGRELRAALSGRRSVDLLWKVARTTVADWEAGFQRALARTLEELVANADPDFELGEDGRLLLARGARSNVRERLDYLLKDYGTRPRPLQQRELEYEVVHLVTRFQRDYPGIRAEETRVRLYPEPEGFAAPPFGELIGNLSAVGLSELQLQRYQARRFRDLSQSPDRSAEEDRALLALLESLWRHDDVRGVAGIEGFFDPELRGQNGFRESWGMKQALAAEEGRRALTEPEDGDDVRLTLDHRVQRAAQRTLANPEHDVTDPTVDATWLANPVGAIVMITVEGDVIAAASEPTEASRIAPDAPSQRRFVVERTMRIPYFQPPGSVFKPFVAAWALDRAGLDPRETVECAILPEKNWAGYGDVRCHSRYGHGDRDLRQAIACSCNAYFSWLGERLAPEDFVNLAQEFGFYAPTGVRTPPPWADDELVPRTGLREDYEPGLHGTALYRKLERDQLRQRAGNGLSVIEVTPLQLARAMAGLSRGWLPELRLVDHIGDRDLERRPARPIHLAERHLERVREAMFAVTNEQKEGSAFKALSTYQLEGLEVCAKTGSADIAVAKEGEGNQVRKHTWVAGWLPREAPKVAFVVFCHDVAVTSSHSAVYVARQFLLQPETVEWLGERGVSYGVERGAREDAR